MSRPVTTRSQNAADFAGATPVLIPTMGALHEGHLALIRQGAQAARRRGVPVVVSVFVNPTQFNEASDFERYPRDLDRDADLAGEAGASIVWAPDPDEVYPPGVDVPVEPLPAVATQPHLEDVARPGHFAGVVQVVRRLFALTRASAAVFGEKDWQQLQVVRAMVRDEVLGVDVLAGPTVRETDGLAMASRNVFLSPKERAAAVAVPRAIAAAQECATPGEAERAMRRVLEGGGLAVEYAAVRDAESLMPLKPGGRDGRAVVVARSGLTRLLDNGPWPA